MALIICPECKKDVSDMASTCPHCGYPLLQYVKSMKNDQLVLSQADSSCQPEPMGFKCNYCGYECAREEAVCPSCRQPASWEKIRIKNQTETDKKLTDKMPLQTNNGLIARKKEILALL